MKLTIILKSLATLASTLIIFPFILGAASEQSPWGYKAFMMATGLSLIAAIYIWTTNNLFKD